MGGDSSHTLILSITGKVKTSEDNSQSQKHVKDI